MKICPKCGSINGDGSNNCTKCGTPLGANQHSSVRQDINPRRPSSDTNVSPEQTESNTTKNILIGALVIAVVLGLIVLSIFLLNWIKAAFPILFVIIMIIIIIRSILSND